MNKTANQGSMNAGNAVAHARMSATTSVEGERLLAAQIAAIRGYAGEHGLNLTTEFVERDFGGADDDRPVFRRMLHEILTPDSKVDMIIVTEGSRFMRHAIDARAEKEALLRHGIRVIVVREDVIDHTHGHLADGVS